MTLCGFVASILMWLGSILFVGSFVRNPALPGARLDRGRKPEGVFAITRHPMMWGFASWAIVHLIVVGTAKAMVFDGAILLLALGGSVGQDPKKAKLMGERLARMGGADRRSSRSAEASLIPERPR